MAARFPTSRWSRVIRAGNPVDPGAATALEDLCGDYWFPLYAFVRRHGVSPNEAADIVQGLLCDLIERGDMARIDQSKGRFRSFLRAACEHYLANCRDYDRAGKRVGKLTIVSINRIDAESRYDREPYHELTAERLFERQWALTVLSRVLERLEEESARADRAGLFAPASGAAGRHPGLLLFHHRRRIGNERRSRPGCRASAASPLPQVAPRGGRPHDRRPNRDRFGDW